MASTEVTGRTAAVLRRASTVALGAMSVALVASACGSDAEKRKPGPTYDGDAGAAPVGGTGGEGGNGGSLPNGGAPDAGDAGAGGGLPAEGGAAGAAQAGAGGLPNSAGAAGAAGAPGSGCPDGFGDCDQNPDDCETPLDTNANCGECGRSCSSTNGVSTCEDLSCTVESCDAGFADCNDSGTDGCEVAVNTVAHCGSCDNDCGSGTCNAAGYCNSVDIGAPYYIARSFFAGDSIYRLSVPAPNYGVQGSYSLVRTPVDGSAETVIDAQNKQVGGMVATASEVYWGVGGTPPGVFKKALTAAAADAPTPVFEPVTLPMQMVIQGSNLYFMGLDGQIYSRPMAAASTEPGTMIVTAAEVAGTGTFNVHQALVATPTRLYWVVVGAGGPYLRTAPIAGGTAADVAGAKPRAWTPLAVSGEDVYWVQASGSAFDGIYRYSHGATASGLVFKSNLSNVAVDSGWLYFMEAESKLYKVPLSGGVGTQIGLAASSSTDIVGFGSKSTYMSAAWTRGSGFFNGKAYVLSK